MRAWLVASFLLLSFTYQPEGKSVILFNASFNSQNDYNDFGKLYGARLYKVDIEDRPSLKEKYNVTRIPTIIILRDGREMWRWEAGIDMKLHTHYMEIQETINRY